ncbi:MAG TPA: FHA domain-containing protein [Gemmatimonadaceae bacterium]
MTTPAERKAKFVASLPNGLTQEFTLTGASATIGRHASCDFVLDDDTVSRLHARVERTDGGFALMDLGSSNGLLVNGERTTFQLLEPGDVIHVGDCVLRFEGSADDVAVTRESRRGRATLLDVRLPVVAEDDRGPSVAVNTPGRTWEVPLPSDRLTIGREGDNDVALDEGGVSRYHAVVERRGPSWTVRDLNSSNGTWVGTARISRTVLNDGESFRIGSATFVLKLGSTATAELDTRGFDGARRPVVVVPGFAGSNLYRGSEQVWPSLKLLGHPEFLRVERPLEARGILDQLVVVPGLLKLAQYSALTEYLRRSLDYEVGRDLLEFAYDFRQDNRRSAMELGTAIEQWNPSAPITIIAHSMGCLIARYYIERLGGKRRVERVILLGGPHAGNPYAFAGLLSGPHLLPLGMKNAQWREQLATFASWYQILPTNPCISDGGTSLDVLGDDSWVPEQHRPLLHDARRFREELPTHSSVPAVCVFGYGIRTIAGASITRAAGGEILNADLRYTDAGDGMIPQESAILPGAEIHPVRQQHGQLYVDDDVRMRLKLELTRPAGSVSA